MAVECVVITLIFAAIIFSFAHANRIKWVIATVPLCILPFANSVANVICTNILHIDLPREAAFSVILISAMVSCIWVGVASGVLLTKRMRIPYLCVGLLFNLVLGMILTFHYM